MSAIKYKIDFTINAETLFTLLSKFLPIDNLHVEEVVERPDPNFERIAKVEQIVARPKPVRAPQVRRKKGSGFKLNPHAGANKIIMAMLADGNAHHAVEADGALMEAGFSVNGLSGKMKRLARHGYVFQPAKGLWQLTPLSKERKQ